MWEQGGERESRNYALGLCIGEESKGGKAGAYCCKVCTLEKRTCVYFGIAMLTLKQTIYVEYYCQYVRTSERVTAKAPPVRGTPVATNITRTP